MVHNDSPIRDFKDLEAHTIAAQTGATWLKYVTLRYGLRQVREIPSTLSIASFLADPATCSRYSSPANFFLRSKPALRCERC